MQFDSKKMLITGGLGHIGSHIIRFQTGSTVIDDLSTQRYCSIFRIDPDLPQNDAGSFIFLHRDFDSLTVEELSKFDIVIHLAAITDAANSFNDRDRVERINVVKTVDLIHKATDAGVKLFIFPSSTSVYGNGDAIMTEDNPDCINPQSPYAEAKIKIEEKLRCSGLRYIILRFGTIFGTSPGMRFHTAINKFCFQACMGEPLTVWKQNFYHKRPYLALDDMRRAINLFVGAFTGLELNRGLITPSAINQIYNVVSENRTLNEVIQMICEEIGDASSLIINMVDTPLLNQHSYEVDFSKISKLGYDPGTNIRFGIRDTIRLLSRIKPA